MAFQNIISWISVQFFVQNIRCVLSASRHLSKKLLGTLESSGYEGIKDRIYERAKRKKKRGKETK